jgi:lysophospholipase L1-like esterase
MTQRVDEVAALLKKNGITPIFFTICPINLTINPAFRETNAYIRENYLYVDMEQVFLNVDAVNGNPTASDIKTELYFDDKVHPNAEGHQMIFNRIKMDCPFLF